MTDNINFALLIKNFKNIKQAQFGFTPLTILTGVNSGGKSSVIQAILLLASFQQLHNSELNDLVGAFNDFEVARNQNLNSDEIMIDVMTHSWHLNVKIDKSNDNRLAGGGTPIQFQFNEYLFYLSANRIGPENVAKLSNKSVVGLDGSHLFGFYEKNKDSIFSLKFKDFDFNDSRFDKQLQEWMKTILNLDITLITKKLTADSAEVKFKINEIEFDPRNVGAGNSYLAKILIMCLQAKRGGYVIIENPEIHLHPKAQAKLGEFFAKLVDAGVNLIIETHSEHIINKIRYCVYKNIIPNKKVAIYYKPSIADDFIHLELNENGRYIDPDGNRRDFPEGFFDATLDDLMSIRNA